MSQNSQNRVPLYPQVSRLAAEGQNVNVVHQIGQGSVSQLAGATTAPHENQSGKPPLPALRQSQNSLQ